MTTVSEDRDTLNFAEFKAAIGASDHAVRDALASLGLRPERDFRDARQQRYRREWVERVRAEVERMRQ